MNSKNNSDISKLTFAQREGRAPLPEPMRLKHIPKKFRQLAWLAIDTTIQKHTRIIQDNVLVAEIYVPRKRYRKDSRLGHIFAEYLFNVREDFHTAIPAPNPYEDARLTKGIIQSGEYDEVLTFIEHILRDENCPTELYESLVKAFEETPIAYFIMRTGNQLTIAPRTSKRLSESVQKSLSTIRSIGMGGSVTHLHQAAEHIKKQQYPDSIVDSIHAVESIACVMDPNSNSTLGKALNSLSHHGILKHLPLVKILETLYGWTSNEPGLRHGLKDKGIADVGLDEAVLLFGACACFADYLASKHQQLQKQTDGDS